MSGRGKNQTIGHITLINCRQKLDFADGSNWENVVFVNSTIIYEGGPITLKNVTFINCRFEVKRNDAGFELLQYAALGEKELRAPA